MNIKGLYTNYVTAYNNAMAVLDYISNKHDNLDIYSGEKSYRIHSHSVLGFTVSHNESEVDKDLDDYLNSLVASRSGYFNRTIINSFIMRVLEKYFNRQGGESK